MHGTEYNTTDLHFTEELHTFALQSVLSKSPVRPSRTGPKIQMAQRVIVGHSVTIGVLKHNIAVYLVNPALLCSTICCCLPVEVS